MYRKRNKPISAITHFECELHHSYSVFVLHGRCNGCTKILCLQFNIVVFVAAIRHEDGTVRFENAGGITFVAFTIVYEYVH